jgi:hypothetical protein
MRLQQNTNYNKIIVPFFSLFLGHFGDTAVHLKKKDQEVLLSEKN